MSLAKGEPAMEPETTKATKSCGEGDFLIFKNAKRLDLSFSDINYSIRPWFFSSEKKTVLSNVSGNFRAGELTAIMGPSGAGKTMLMDILAGYLTKSVGGDVMINGRVRDLKAFRRSSAYIMQHHVCHDLLTVQESMHIVAELKLGVSAAEKKKRINVLLKELGLADVRAAFAGSLSGGQKKRLAIAMELISDLPIMFFDEPTSGLDSVTARQCVELLKSLASTGRTVVCTIHQPSAALFGILDNLYVIAKGHCIYTGSPSNVVPFLDSMGLYCPNYHNPADFLLEIVGGEYGSDHIVRLTEAIKKGSSCRYRSDSSCKNNQQPQDQELTSTNDRPNLLQKQLPSKSAFYEACDPANQYASSSWTQIRVLLYRYVLRTYRDREYIMAILIAHLVMAFVAGLTFQGVGQNALRATDNVKYIIFNLIFISFCAINASLITFPAELPVMTREYFNRWYKLRSVYIANKIIGFVIAAFAVSSYTIITYYLTDQLPELRRLGFLLFTNIAIALVHQVMGLLISVILNVKNVVFFGSTSIIPFMLFSGIFLPLPQTNPLFAWIYEFSTFKYAYDAALMSIFGFDRPRMKCMHEYCHYASPKSIFALTGANSKNYWFSTFLLMGIYFVLHIITYFCLRYKLKTTKYR